jgi:hypothetical protein
MNTVELRAPGSGFTQAIRWEHLTAAQVRDRFYPGQKLTRLMVPKSLRPGADYCTVWMLEKEPFVQLVEIP